MKSNHLFAKQRANSRFITGDQKVTNSIKIEEEHRLIWQGKRANGEWRRRIGTGEVGRGKIFNFG